nr:MarR family transcriptional regulator [Nitrosomonas nitrosa]
MAAVQVEFADTRLTRLGFALADATRLMRAAFDHRMRSIGLRGSGWRVLAYLYRKDGLSQTELARLLEVTRAAVGQTVDQLEASGHVIRRSDRGDARRWLVHLHPECRAKMSDMFDVVRGFENDLCDVFSDRELEQLYGLVERLRDRASAIAPIRPAKEP